jgi:microcystin-dependent protein
MGTPFMGEVKIVAFNFAPKGWALCNGQFLPINQNQALFSLLGTTYGGNGQTTFALPDLRGCASMHIGNGYIQGQKAGQESHTLTISETPQHLHVAQASGDNASADIPAAGVMLATASLDLYRDPTSLVAMEPGVVGNTGGSQAHNNMQPYLVLNFCIALQGAFPSRN